MHKSFRKFAAGALALLVLGLSVPAYAQTGTTDTSNLISQVQNLLQQVKTLQDKLAALETQKGQVRSELSNTLKLTRQLTMGMSGDDIKELQEILAADPDIYPEGLITGYFGALTQKAVRKFQQKHGIEQVGEVGPKTKIALQNYLSGLSTSTAGIPHGLAKKFNNIATSTDLSNAIDGFKITICHKGNTQSVALPALSAHLGHGDMVGLCSGTTNPPPATTTDTVAPVVSNLSATSTGSSTATVSWTTNENATTKLWYGTTTPLDLTGVNTQSESNSTLKTAQSFNLSSLVASTTYYFIAVSKDAAGNTASSSQMSFTTQ